MKIAPGARSACLALLGSQILFLAGWAGRAEATYGSKFNLTLSGNRTVKVDNISGFSDSRVGVLVILADRGMATKAVSTNTNAVGLMNTADVVVVTRWGIYWLSLLERAGEMGGMWALNPDAPGDLNFKYFANGEAWSPNYLMPGSRGFIGTDVDDHYVSGFTMATTPEGYSDGQAGNINGGGFVTSFNRRYDDMAAADGASAGGWSNSLDGLDQSNGQHLYQFIGYARQLPNTGPPKGDSRYVPPYGNILVTQKDAQNNTVRGYFRYVNTYVFYDATNPLVAQQRVRYVSSINTEVIPTNRMSLQVNEMVVAVTSNFLSSTKGGSPGTLGYPSMLYNIGNKPRNRYFGLTSVSSYGNYATGYLDPNQSDYQYISHTLSYYRRGYGHILDANDFVSTCQDGAFNNSGAPTRMISMEVPGETNFVRPERHDHIYDRANSALSLNFTYWNSNTTEPDGSHADAPEFMSSGNPYSFAFDMTMERR